jgi:predicted AAA+ superfamily ATPase
MTDSLVRIAIALERLAPRPAPTIDWSAHPGYVWDRTGVRTVTRIEAPPLALLQAIDAQKAAVATNVERLARGAAAHDMLLWGARGMGKSALLRAAVMAAQAERPGALALVQAAPDALSILPALFAALRGSERRFLVFLDDLGFESGETLAARHLRSWLEGGVEARPGNVRLAVTSNRRAILERHLSEQASPFQEDGPINPRDAVDDKLALADRFGLSVGFHACSQDDYLAIVAGYADAAGLTWEGGDALDWARRRGSRSGRVAWQYVTELAGRAGMPLG